MVKLNWQNSQQTIIGRERKKNRVKYETSNIFVLPVRQKANIKKKVIKQKVHMQKGYSQVIITFSFQSKEEQ